MHCGMFLSQSVSDTDTHDGQLNVSLWVFSFRWIFWRTSSTQQLPDDFEKHAEININTEIISVCTDEYVTQMYVSISYYCTLMLWLLADTFCVSNTLNNMQTARVVHSFRMVSLLTPPPSC